MLVVIFMMSINVTIHKSLIEIMKRKILLAEYNINFHFLVSFFSLTELVS